MNVVACVAGGPRFYNGSFDPPPELTSAGLVLHLVAYPVPQRFRFTLAYNDTAQMDGLEELFQSQCLRHDYAKHLVVCTLQRRAIPEEYFGVYNVTISNAFGDFRFRMTVNSTGEDKDKWLSVANTYQDKRIGLSLRFT